LPKGATRFGCIEKSSRHAVESLYICGGYIQRLNAIAQNQQQEKG